MQQRLQVSRPRVRSKSGEEASLPHFEAFREEDPLPERVLNQILVGVSTRNYESSLDKPAAKLKSQYNHFKYLYLNSLLNIDLMMFIKLKCSRYVNITI